MVIYLSGHLPGQPSFMSSVLSVKARYLAHGHIGYGIGTFYMVVLKRLTSKPAAGYGAFLTALVGLLNMLDLPASALIAGCAEYFIT